VPEVSPSLRLAYRASPQHTFWAAASRSITLPSYSQIDMEFRVQQVPPAWYLQALGTPDSLIPPGAGKWIAILAQGDVKPSNYYMLEAGNRGLLGSRLQWDVSTFYLWARNQLSITNLDSDFKTVVPSRANPGDTVIPIYNANIAQYETMGCEAVVRWLATGGLRLEYSLSVYLDFNRKGLSQAGDIGSNSEDELALSNQTPKYVSRIRADLDLPFDMDLTAFALIPTRYASGSKFNYITQRPDPNEGMDVAKNRPFMYLDLTLRKSFHKDRMMAMIWGHNLLAGEPYEDFYNQYVWSSYPHRIHRTFGGGLEYRF
jgi:outer membrane receptor protein involved in Fe transport